jgi:hypothetical protein
MRIRTRWILIAGWVFLTSLPVASQTVLDFENLPAGTTINDQFVRQGVRFSSAFLAADRAAHSGNRVLRTINPASEVFTPIPLRMTFVRPQAHIKLFAMSPGTARNGTLVAFDASGAEIARDGPKPVAADKFTTMFEVTVRGAQISRAELQLENAAHFAIDDLEFDVRSASATPTVKVNELRQPAAKDNPAVKGTFPNDFRLAQPAQPRERPPSKPRAGEEGEEERFNIESQPTVIKTLAPRASADLRIRVSPRTGLAGSVRWIGTSAPLSVTISLGRSRLATGKTYALGANRGGADVGAVAQNAGEVRLVVTNTSNVRVKVSLSLGIVRTPVR